MRAKAKPRDIAKQETREALIQAGMASFSEAGIDLPSLDAICARAGFTRGAFYVHFKDREDFFAAVVDRVLQDFVNWVLPVGGDEADGHGKAGGLDRVVDRFLDVVREGKLFRHRLFLQIVARGAQSDGAINRPYRALIDEAIVRLSRAAEQGQARGEVKRDLDPTQLGLMLVASGVGFISLVESGYLADFEKLRAFMRGLLLEKLP